MAVSGVSDSRGLSALQGGSDGCDGWLAAWPPSSRLLGTESGELNWAVRLKGLGGEGRRGVWR